MKNLIKSLLVATSLTSCYHVYYSPNTANAPLLTEKGETKINAMYSTGGNSEFNGGEFQVAHAAGKHFALMTNVFFAAKSEETSDWYGNHAVEKGNGSYFEFAAGTFERLDPKKKLIGEVYGGVGFGSAKNDYGNDNSSKVNNTKFFIQPSIGYKSKYFEAAFVPKMSYITWKVNEANFNQQGNNDKEEIDAIRGKRAFFSFEPALVFRGGAEAIKVQTALSFSSIAANSGYQYSDLIELLNASIGISINIRQEKFKQHNK